MNGGLLGIQYTTKAQCQIFLIPLIVYVLSFCLSFFGSPSHASVPAIYVNAKEKVYKKKKGRIILERNAVGA